jgi:hypothetical protein
MILVACVVSNMRAIFDSIMSNGILLLGVVDLSGGLEDNDLLVVGATCCLPAFIVAAFLIEKLSHSASSALCNGLHFFNTVGSLAVPWALCDYTGASPLVCGPLIFAATVLFLKLVSYSHTNAVLRRKWVAGETNLGYPQSVTLFDVFQ